MKSRNMPQALLVGTTIALLCTFSVGCGGSKAPMGTVLGKIVIEGVAPQEPLKVIFYNSTTGHGSTGLVKSKGEFLLAQSIPVGEYKVFFEKIVSSENETTSAADYAIKSMDSIYGREESTPLNINITQGKNELTLEATAAKAKRSKR